MFGCMHGVLFNALHCLIENRLVLFGYFWPLSCSFTNAPTIRILGDLPNCIVRVGYLKRHGTVWREASER